MFLSKLTDALSSMSHELFMLRGQRDNELSWFKSRYDFVTKLDLKQMENNIMSTISDFASKQNQFNNRLDVAITGLAGDIDGLNAEIQAIQNSTGSISDEDQTSLNEIEARSDAIAMKLEALDALTPPVVPVVPPTGSVDTGSFDPTELFSGSFDPSELVD